MQAKFLKLDIEKFQNDISFLKEGMVAILAKMDNYSRKTTGPFSSAREDSQGLEQAQKSVHETEKKLKGVKANDRELKSDFQKIDFGKLQEDERSHQQPPVLEVLGQTPLNSNSGNNKEQETCLFDVSSPPSSSMYSLSQRLEIFEGLKLEGGPLKAESYFDSYFELVNLSTPTKKVWSAVVYLRNDLLFLDYCGEYQRPSCNWEEFRKLLAERQGFWIRKKRKKKE